ncbi:MAG: hypothetical protein WCC74_02135 [Minisyncoccia bacterium]
MTTEEQIKKYEEKYEEAINHSDELLKFDLSVDILNIKEKPPVFYQNDCNKITNRAINSARLYIDELININKFKEAGKFCNDAKIKLQTLDLLMPYKNSIIIDTENFFETYQYRIIDRQYIHDAKSKIEEIEKKSENKIFEILTIFVTIISVIFAFVNGGSVKVFSFRVPAFVLLALTIIFSWWIIKKINSNK